MTGRRFFLAHIRGVAIQTGARLLILRELFFDRHGLRIRSLLAVLVTRCAGGDRHVRRQASQRACAGDIDVASGALQRMFAFAAGVIELRGNALRPVAISKAGRSLVTSSAVSGSRFFIFPVTVET